MRFIFSLSLVTFLAVALALASNHHGFAQQLTIPVFALTTLGVILYLLELINE